MPTAGTGPTLLFHLYRLATRALVPFAWAVVSRKLARHGVAPERMHERLGHASLPRPATRPIWFHAASVGESLSVLALIARIGARLPQAQFLITSGTATSAELIGKRLPPRTRHQFAPLDAPGPVARFLSHWRPQAGIFVESELWPQLLRQSFESGVKLALVNARLSEKSIDRWRRHPALARYLLDVFRLIVTQNDAMADAMVAMHAPADRVARGINLKSMADPLPVDEDTLLEARAALGHRPVWIASSTHEGEEQVVLAAHKALLAAHPDLCLILAPRHPERGNDVMNLIAGAGLGLTRRTGGDAPGAEVFLADTLGELGTWYALGDIVFLGGSLRPIGGHNPFEVAQAGAVVLSGPHVANFAETFALMETYGAAWHVSDAADLAARVDHLLRDTGERDRACAAATAFAGAQTDRLDDIARRLIAALELAP